MIGFPLLDERFTDTWISCRAKLPYKRQWDIIFISRYPPLLVALYPSFLRRVYQTGLKTRSSLLLGGFSKITASQYDCSQHCVHSVLWNRIPPFSHPHILASGLVASGHRHVHDLDRTWLSRLLRGLHCMEREYHKLGTSLVRYRYVRTFLHSILISDGPYPATRIQLAVAVAWPACGLCIVRRLYSIASATAVTTNRAQVSYWIRLGVTKGYLDIKRL